MKHVDVVKTAEIIIDISTKKHKANNQQPMKHVDYELELFHAINVIYKIKVT